MFDLYRSPAVAGSVQTPIPDSDRYDARELERMCRQVLSRNWREGTRGGTRYAYTSPSPGRYPWQVALRTVVMAATGAALNGRASCGSIE